MPMLFRLDKKLTAAAADTDMQGALLDPIIYDKLLSAYDITFPVL